MIRVSVNGLLDPLDRCVAQQFAPHLAALLTQCAVCHF